MKPNQPAERPANQTDLIESQRYQRTRRGMFAAIGLIFATIGGWLAVKSSQQPASNVGTNNVSALLFGLNTPCANTVNNGVKSIEELKGKLLLVNFWASWCAPCIEEMPALDQLRAQLQGSNTSKLVSAKSVEIVGIAIDTPINVAQFLKKVSIKYPLFSVGAAGSELSKLMGNPQGLLPFTVLLNTQGDIVWKHLGVLNIDETSGQIRQMM